MKKFFLVSVLFTIYALNAQTLEEKKIELEKQIKELETKKEIKELEKKLKALQQEVQSTEDEVQNTHDDEQDEQLIYSDAIDPEQIAFVTQEQSNKTTREYRDAQAKKWFGKNRNGLLIGVGYGRAKFTSQGKDFTYTHRLPSNILIPEVTKDSYATRLAPDYYRLGYQQFVSFRHASRSPLGFRIYADYINMLGHSSQTIYAKEQKITAQEVYSYAFSGNLDVLLEVNLPNSYSYLGIFGGVGYGIMQHKASYDCVLKNNNSSSAISEEYSFRKMGLFYNLGVALTLAAKHRFEFYYKILPIKQYEEGSFSYKTSDYMAFSYQYTF